MAQSLFAAQCEITALCECAARYRISSCGVMK